MSRRVVVIGGGIGGATAALRLRQAGADVVLLEAAARLGGLVASFEVNGTPLECFYHHVFPHERAIRGLVDEMGLTARLDWRTSSIGVYTGGRVWPFTTPVDLLRFRPLSLVDRLRAGLAAVRLPRVRDWEALDGVSAAEWLAAASGPQVAALVWDPLLAQKFGTAAADVPAAWMWGRFTQRAGAHTNPFSRERLGYLRGGFRQLFDALHARLASLGVDVRLDARASAIDVEGGHAAGVAAGGERIEADAVLYAGTLPGLTPLVPAEVADPRWAAIGGLGAMCVVVEMRGPLQDLYWVNVCDATLPFGGIIEQTNLVPAADYGGRHVAYLSRYFTADEPIASCDLAAEANRWVAVLSDRFGLGPDDIVGVHPFRTPYAAPLVTLGYRARIPPERSSVTGLYVATTAQIYPQDRGMNEGVLAGSRVAEAIGADLRLAGSPV